MKILSSIAALLLFAGCATTPYDNEASAGVKIYITLGEGTSVKDITVTIASDAVTDSESTADQSPTNTTDVKTKIPIPGAP